MTTILTALALICHGIVTNDTVTIEGGKVQGTIQDGRALFHGIQYAKAARYEASKLNPLKGNLDGTVRGPSCWQPGSKGTKIEKGWETIQIPESAEECLFLSVYSPILKKSDSNKKFPVLVYMHAGEFLYGSSNDAESNFPYFSDSVVMVTPNYRLGFFGFSYGPGVGNGNLGMQDQRLALKWVQRYISLFNGDPTKVTIMGESSGGTSVGFHLVNKKSWGLFHRAIAESPGLTQVKNETLAIQNTEFLAVSLSLKYQQACPTRQFFFKRFENRLLSGFVALSKNKKPSFNEAKKACSHIPICVGIVESIHDKQYWLVKKDGVANKVLGVSVDSGYNLYLKWIVQKELPKCLRRASAVDIAIAMQQSLPFADSFTTDEFAPVVVTKPMPPRGGMDVELRSTILDHFSSGEIAPNVDVLMGSNLDEASIMMSLLPRFPCNSTFDYFRNWTNEVYGDDGPKVAKMYEKLTPPLPLCRDEATNEVVQSPWRVAAMRTAGDQAILCPLKSALTKVAERGSRGYQYYFMKSPTYSLNYNLAGGVKGSFHGAEVPYVFGFPDELQTAADKELSKTMGCYWNSFIHTGNPSDEQFCPPTALNPKWDSYNSLGSDPCAILGRGSAVIETGIQSDQCTLFSKLPKPSTIHVPPLVNGTPQGSDSSFIPNRAALLYTCLVFVVFIGGVCAYRHFFNSSPESPKGPDGEA